MNLYPSSARRKNTLFIVKKYFNFFQLLTLMIIFTFYIKVENKYEIFKRHSATYNAPFFPSFDILICMIGKLFDFQE